MPLDIEIARRNFLLYLVLSHPAKMRRLTPDSRARLDRINAQVNEAVYSGEGAASYDWLHRYAEQEQHEYPARILVSERWPGAQGYGRALELGAGSGYFTPLIARHARSVVAAEPVADMREVIRARCAAEGVGNVEVADIAAEDLPARVPEASVDSAILIQSVHHLHRRPELFGALGRVVRPGGRLFMLEPHHNLRRVARLLRHYRRTYRAPAFWTDERQWATHDFLTVGEIRRLCRLGRFADVRISGFWIPYSRRVVPDPLARFRVEAALGRLPGIRHAAAVLAVEARRR